LAAANFSEFERIEGENLVDGELVLAARGGEVFVVVEIGSGEEEDIGISGEDLAERVANANELVIRKRADGDGDNFGCGSEELEERKLNFEGVFGFVSQLVFAKDGRGVENFSGERGVYGNIAERSAPCATGNDGGVFAIRKMADAEDDDAIGKVDAGEDLSGDGAGVNIAGVRNETGAKFCQRGPGFCGAGGNAFAKESGECGGFSGIESAGNSGKAKHGGSAKLGSFRGLTFDLEGFFGVGVEENGDLVAVLKAALVNDGQHFCGGGFGERESLNSHFVVFGADSYLRHGGIDDGAFKFRLRVFVGLDGVYDDGNRGVDGGFRGLGYDGSRNLSMSGRSCDERGSAAECNFKKSVLEKFIHATVIRLHRWQCEEI